MALRASSTQALQKKGAVPSVARTALDALYYSDYALFTKPLQQL